MPNPCHNNLVIAAELPDDENAAAERLEELHCLKAKLLEVPTLSCCVEVEGKTLTAEFETGWDPPLLAIRSLGPGHPHWQIRFSYLVEDYTADVSGVLHWNGMTWVEEHTSEEYRPK